MQFDTRLRANGFSEISPTVTQRVDGEPKGDRSPTNGAGGSRSDAGEEIVFKSSPAMKVLNLPEPAMATEAPKATPASKKGGFAWPVAFVVAAIVGAGAYVYTDMQRKAAMDSNALSANAVATNTEAVGNAHQGTAGSGSTETSSHAAAAFDSGVNSVDATVTATATSSADESATPSENRASTANAAVQEKLSNPKSDSDKGKETHAERSSDRREGKPRQETKSDKGSVAKTEGESAAKPIEEKQEGKDGKDGKKEGKGQAKDLLAAEGAEGADKAEKKPDELDSLLDSAVGGGAGKKKEAAPATETKEAKVDESLPEQLTMNQIRDGMNRIKNDVQRCYDQFQVEGLANVDVTIENSGEVSNAAVKGKFFGTDTGNCVEKAVMKARFEKTRGKAIKIMYPFRLQ